MKLIRSFPFLAFALVMIALAGLCLAQGSFELLLLAGTLSAVSWYVTEGPRGRSLPRWVSNILIVGASLNVFVELLGNRREVLDMLGNFCVWLTLIKLYERKTPRDYSQLLSLSLLMMLVGCLRTSTLAFGLVMAAYAVLGVYVVAMFRLHASFEDAKSVRDRSIPGGSRLVPPLRPLIGRHPVLHFRALVAACSVIGLVLSGLLFVAFPRGVGAGMIHVNLPSAQRRTTFTERVDLSSSTRINASRARALTVQVLDGEGRIVQPEGPLYLRGAVLDVYEGDGRWRSTYDGPARTMSRTFGGDYRRLETKADEPLWLGDGPLVPARQPQRLLIHTLIDSPVLFTAWSPRSVKLERAAALTYERRGQVLRPGEGAGRIRTYEIEFDATPPEQALAALTDALDPAIALRNQGNHRFPRSIRRLARDIAGDAVQPRTGESAWQVRARLARLLNDHLASSGGYTYDLDLSDVRAVDDSTSGDPIERFLFQTKRGHCEYFASALTALCRALDIEARIVTGYLAYNYDGETSQYSVLESNAHAWVEVRTGVHAWTVFDPTPPAALDLQHRVDESVADQVRWSVQDVESVYGAVVDFDQGAQGNLATALDMGFSRRLTAALQATREWLERVNQAFYFGPAGYIWMGIVGIALIIAIITLVRLMRRSMRITRLAKLENVHGRDYQRLLRQLGFYVDMLAVLDRAGRRKPDWQPPLAHLEQQSQSGMAQAAATLVREITTAFYAIRYGDQRPAGDELRTMRSKVEELARTLNVKMPTRI